MELEFAQNMKRSWYCPKISIQCSDIDEGARLMRKAIKKVNTLLVETDQPIASKTGGGWVKGLKE